MLILTRWPNQTIQIGDNITLKVIQAQGHRVRIGIDAPVSIPVDRSECAAKRRKDQGRDNERFINTTVNA